MKTTTSKKQWKTILMSGLLSLGLSGCVQNGFGDETPVKTPPNNPKPTKPSDPKPTKPTEPNDPKPTKPSDPKPVEQKIIKASLKIDEQVMSSYGDSKDDFAVTSMLDTAKYSQGEIKTFEGSVVFLDKGERSIGSAVVKDGKVDFSARGMSEGLLMYDDFFSSRSKKNLKDYLDKATSTSSFARLQEMVSKSIKQKDYEPLSILSHAYYAKAIKEVATEVQEKIKTEQKISAQASSTAKALDGNISVSAQGKDWTIDNRYAVYYIMVVNGKEEYINPKKGLYGFEVNSGELKNIIWSPQRVSNKTLGQQTDYTNHNTKQDFVVDFYTGNMFDVLSGNNHIRKAGYINTGHIILTSINKLISFKGDGNKDQNDKSLYGKLQKLGEETHKFLSDGHDGLITVAIYSNHLQSIYNSYKSLSKALELAGYDKDIIDSELKKYQNLEGLLKLIAGPNLEDPKLTDIDDEIRELRRQPLHKRREIAKELQKKHNIKIQEIGNTIRNHRLDLYKEHAQSSNILNITGFASEILDVWTSDSNNLIKTLESLEIGLKNDSIKKFLHKRAEQSAIYKNFIKTDIFKKYTKFAGKYSAVLKTTELANEMIPITYDFFNAPKHVKLFYYGGKIHPNPLPKLASLYVTQNGINRHIIKGSKQKDSSEFYFSDGECFKLYAKADYHAMVKEADQLPLKTWSLSWSFPLRHTHHGSMKMANLVFYGKDYKNVLEFQINSDKNKGRYNIFKTLHKGSRTEKVISANNHTELSSKLTTSPYGIFHNTSQSQHLILTNNGPFDFCPKNDQESLYVIYGNKETQRTRGMLFTKKQNVDVERDNYIFSINFEEQKGGEYKFKINSTLATKDQGRIKWTVSENDVNKFTGTGSSFAVNLEQDAKYTLTASIGNKSQYLYFQPTSLKLETSNTKLSQGETISIFPWQHKISTLPFPWNDENTADKIPATVKLTTDNNDLVKIQGNQITALTDKQEDVIIKNTTSWFPTETITLHLNGGKPEYTTKIQLKCPSHVLFDYSNLKPCKAEAYNDENKLIKSQPSFQYKISKKDPSIKIDSNSGVISFVNETKPNTRGIADIARDITVVATTNVNGKEIKSTQKVSVTKIKLDCPKEIYTKTTSKDNKMCKAKIVDADNKEVSSGKVRLPDKLSYTYEVEKPWIASQYPSIDENSGQITMNASDSAPDTFKVFAKVKIPPNDLAFHYMRSETAEIKVKLPDVKIDLEGKQQTISVGKESSPIRATVSNANFPNVTWTVKPNTATLIPRGNGNTVIFKSNTVGEYTVTATSTANPTITKSTKIKVQNFLEPDPTTSGKAEISVLNIANNNGISGVNFELCKYTTADCKTVRPTEQSTGVYTMTLPEGKHSLNVQKDGFLPARIEEINITRGNTTILEKVLAIDESITGEGKIGGRLVNAVTGNAVPLAKIRIRKGLSNKTGPIIDTITSDAQGYFTYTGQTGYYHFSASHKDFTDVHFNASLVGLRTSNEGDKGMSPLMPADGAWRAVLTWGENPADLDLHASGPRSKQGRFHVFWDRKVYKDAVSDINLDLDDTSSFGPETITLEKSTGLIKYSVHNYTHKNYSNSNVLSKSGAKVHLYKGNQLYNIYHVPNDRVGNFWSVFTLDLSNPARPKITPINTINNAYKP